MSDKNKDTVSLRFVGSRIVRRIIGDIEWGPDNGHVNDAPIELAAELLNSRESNNWELVGKPKAATLRQLAELMGLAPADLIVVVGDDNEESKQEVIENG